MSFVAHAQAHGLIINHAIPDGRWHRVPTVDKPRKRNGAYIFDGNSGVVKNWATMESFARYGEKVNQFIRYFDNTEEKIRHERAAKQAQEIITRAVISEHDYLKRKGFETMKGLVADEELIVPMRDFKTHQPTSVQRIKADGSKKFLPGGRTKNAVFVIGNPRAAVSWLCEGYATGLSIHEALRSMYSEASVIVCFSAYNLVHVGKQVKKGFVFADNDEAGLRAAEELPNPWVKSDVPGEDANDMHRRAGLRAVGSVLRGAIFGKRGGDQVVRLVVGDSP